MLKGKRTERAVGGSVRRRGERHGALGGEMCVGVEGVRSEQASARAKAVELWLGVSG